MYIGLNSLGLSASPFGVVFGPELVTNGTFDVDASGWTAAQSVLSVSGGVLTVTSNAASFGQATQTLTCVIGRTYTVRGQVTNGTGTSATVEAFDGVSQSVIGSPSTASGQTVLGYFTAKTTAPVIKLNVFGASGVAATFDNISVKEVIR